MPDPKPTRRSSSRSSRRTKPITTTTPESTEPAAEPPEPTTEEVTEEVMGDVVLTPRKDGGFDVKDETHHLGSLTPAKGGWNALYPDWNPHCATHKYLCWRPAGSLVPIFYKTREEAVERLLFVASDAR